MAFHFSFPCSGSGTDISPRVQAREPLLERTIQWVVGARRAIIHMYNSTSPAQRRVVFGMSKEETVRGAVRGAQMIKDRLPRLKGTEVMLQYSPESFSATEVKFARGVSEAVMEVWQPTPQNKMILNLPDTVEVAMPNVYADQIECICRNIKNRESLIVSLHTHNDRSTGVAATELGLLAGADRVEGTSVRERRTHGEPRHHHRGHEPLHARHRSQT